MKALKTPDGPRSPAFWQLSRFGRDTVCFLERCRRTYGPVFRLKFPFSPPVFVLSDAELIVELLNRDVDETPPFPANRGTTSIFGRYSLLFKSGAEHRAERSLLTPFLNRKATDAARGGIDQIIDQFLEELDGSQPTISVYGFTHRLALCIAISQFWGCEEDDLVRRIEEAVETSRRRYKTFRHMVLDSLAMERDDHPIASAFFRMVQGQERERLRSTFRDLIDEHVRAMRSDPARLNENPISARLQVGGHADRAVDEAYVDFCMTLLVAGYDPPASITAWLLLELAQQPDLQERIRVECAEGDSVKVSAASPSLQASVLEAYRLYPPLHSITRTALQPVRLGEYELPGGSYIMPSIYLLHRESKHWDAPEQFRPDRFERLERVPSLEQGFLPFGAQKRVCPGRHFAGVLIERTISTIVSRFDIIKVDDVPAPQTFGPTLVPSDTARIALVRR
ncbi:MAG: cytochrome P450 [Pseudomonadota bacterium]